MLFSYYGSSGVNKTNEKKGKATDRKIKNFLIKALVYSSHPSIDVKCIDL